MVKQLNDRQINDVLRLFTNSHNGRRYRKGQMGSRPTIVVKDGEPFFMKCHDVEQVYSAIDIISGEGLNGQVYNFPMYHMYSLGEDSAGDPKLSMYDANDVKVAVIVVSRGCDKIDRALSELVRCVDAVDDEHGDLFCEDEDEDEDEDQGQGQGEAEVTRKGSSFKGRIIGFSDLGDRIKPFT